MKGYEKAAQAIQSVKQVIIGKDDCVLAIMEAILANGHILIEIFREWARRAWRLRLRRFWI